jgi:hypothetical protein
MDLIYRKTCDKLLTLTPNKEITTREISRSLKISTTTVISRMSRYGIKPEVVKEGFTNRAFKWKTNDILTAVQKDMLNAVQGNVQGIN